MPKLLSERFPVPKPVNTEQFVEPLRAVQIIVEECFSTDEQLIISKDPDSVEGKIALKNLKAALRSGSVSAMWESFDHQKSGNLEPGHAALEFFSIDLNENTVFHPKIGAPVYCKINTQELRQFLKGSGAPKPASTKSAETQCERWLIGLMLDNNWRPETVPKLQKVAMSRFLRLSGAGFKRAWKRAIDEAQRSDLSKPGRRKEINR